MVSKMPKKSRRHYLKEKEARRLLFDFSQRLKTDLVRLLGSEPRVEMHETEGAEIFIINGKPMLVRSGGEFFPTLDSKEALQAIPIIVIDMGAVPFICKGADVMVPGVVRVEGEFEENDLILVTDEQHGKPLAIGFALFNSRVMKNMKHGKIMKNIHHVGDRLWNYLRQF